MVKFFNTQNTDGYTDAEIDMLNAAHDKLMGGVDTSEIDDDTLNNTRINLGDAVHNAFIKGIELDELIARASSH